MLNVLVRLFWLSYFASHVFGTKDYKQIKTRAVKKPLNSIGGRERADEPGGPGRYYGTLGGAVWGAEALPS